MKVTFRNLQTRLLPLAAAAAMVAGVGAAHAVQIGFSPVAGGPFVQTDLWTDTTDTAVSTGISKSNPSAIGAVGLFTAQTSVNSMTLNGVNVSPTGLGAPPASAGAFEVTKILRLNEVVTSATQSPFTNAGTIQFGGTANQGVAGGAIDVDNVTSGGGVGNGIGTGLGGTGIGSHNGVQNLAIFLDKSLADGSVHNPASGVSCYGATAAVTSLAGVNCGGGNDGQMIMSAHMISLTSTFTAAAGGVGVGSFNVVFMIDWYDPSYLSGISVGTSFSEIMTGTLNIPAQFSPGAMWDGTPNGAADTTISFKTDSSESFVPEPGSFALAGLALIAAGVARRRSR